MIPSHPRLGAHVDNLPIFDPRWLTPEHTASGPPAAFQIHSLTPQGRDAVARLVSPTLDYAAFSLVSTRTSSPARANKLMSLSILNRLISPFSRLLMRGWVSAK